MRVGPKGALRDGHAVPLLDGEPDLGPHLVEMPGLVADRVIEDRHEQDFDEPLLSQVADLSQPDRRFRELPVGAIDAGVRGELELVIAKDIAWERFAGRPPPRGAAQTIQSPARDLARHRSEGQSAREWRGR